MPLAKDFPCHRCPRLLIAQRLSAQDRAMSLSSGEFVQEWKTNGRWRLDRDRSDPNVQTATSNSAISFVGASSVFHSRDGASSLKRYVSQPGMRSAKVFARRSGFARLLTMRS